MCLTVASALSILPYRTLFLAVSRLIPVPGAAEAFFEEDAGFVTENCARESDVRLRIADIARARRVVFCLDLLAGDFFEQFQDIIQRDPGARTTVENLSGSSRSFAGAERFIHDIFDVGEVARLLTIAIDDGRLIFNECEHEAREHAGILRRGVLARPEHIEEADGGILQAIHAAEDLQIKLADILGNAVRRDWLWLHRLHFRERM